MSEPKITPVEVLKAQIRSCAFRDDVGHPLEDDVAYIQLLETAKKINMVPVKSSNIKAIGYREEDKVLRVEFVNRKELGRPGPVWDYLGVEPETVREMIAAESIGSYFSKHIRPSHHATRVGGVTCLTES